MKRWQAITSGMTAAVLLGSSGIAWATTHEPARATPRPQLAVDNPDTAIESKYTPITPCRIVDTRQAVGRLAANATRSYYATGTFGFSPQGGVSGGCGIPTAATAIQVTVTAVSATGPGYLRAYPANASAPNATFLNYTNAFNTSGSGSVTLGTGGGYHFKVTNYARATHLVVDVQGYYIKPMWALIAPDGHLIKGSRATQLPKSSAGFYSVAFDRDISGCALTATSYYVGYSAQADPNGSGSTRTVNVTTTQGTTLADAQVFVGATC
ncbi:MAG TPA: hypothetical protein VGL21_00445 [Jatrophihabitantaceae bacterium]